MSKPKRLAMQCPGTGPDGNVNLGFTYTAGVPQLVLSNSIGVMAAALDREAATKMRDWLTAWLEAAA